ncbi:MAG: hypothetical protein J6I52_11750 [Prevotella sp.]|nr:hypothetical protein [Prevotella sp.]
MYDKHIDKTEEQLCELREVYSRDEVDRFIDGLESGRIDTEEKIIRFTNFIRNSDGLVHLEYTRLEQLQAEGFIEKFATNYNNRYSTCHMLMNKMRSSISRGLEMLEKLCEKKRSRGRAKSKRKVIDSSKMGNCPFNSSLWALEYYKESVRILYNEIVTFKSNLNKCIDLCLYIIEQVAYIKAHPKDAYEKYQNNRQEVLLNNRSVIRRFIDLKADMDNEVMEKVEELKQQKKSMEEISAMLYHALDEDEYNDWIISEEVMAARRQGISNQERALWGDDKKQVMRCRTAFSHIDELCPKGQKGHIGGRFLALLYKWSKTLPNRGMEYWHTYLSDFYKANGGKLTPVKPGAVKMELGRMARGKVGDDEINEFNKRMEEIVNKYMIESPAKEKGMKKAVNF